VREDGSIHLLGRGNKCVNTAGEKVFPEEVEETAKTHPAVEDCLVFGVPDERLGQRVVAVVEARPNRSVTAVDVTQHVRSLAGYKVPRDVKLVDRVPRTAAGTWRHRLRGPLSLRPQITPRGPAHARPGRVDQGG